MIPWLKQNNNTSARQLKKYFKIVKKINELEEKFVNMSDEELKQMTSIFKDRLDKKETLQSIIPEVFAVVREASKRVLQMRHFDVQLLGGLVLAEGNIAEMPTGEGKTLVASLPSYLKALESKGVHVITVNEYLAKRDFEQIGQIHRFLGLSVGINIPMMTPEDKQQAYLADITYGVGTEFGFDYLRDNMVSNLAQKVQRPFHYAIIDEVDSVLIDEAKTPLIVAGKTSSRAELHSIAAILAKRFKIEEDYDFDPETKATSLTETGIGKVEAAFSIDNLYDLEHQTLYHYVIQAVRAHVMFEKDVDYIVKDDKIHLVDMFTGRIMEGRSLSDGLHQAIEAKENVTLTDENKAQAEITIQNYFRLYPKLSGMTGTAKTQESEFRQVYGMDVIQIPTNRPKIRVDKPDLVFNTSDNKYAAVAKEAKARHMNGQPVLIGTTSILQSEKVANFLDKENLDYHLLNAKSIEQEVELISQAGQLNQITVATNMAGRGTDIVLGEGVADIGGLFVIGTEKHESIRIDNQLRGRAGRQGDPGDTQFFISLEDDIFVRFAKEDVDKMQKVIKTDAEGLINNKDMSEFVSRTQRIVEGSHFSMREYNLKLDDVINDQRNVIYSLRNKILQKQDTLALLHTMVDETINFVIYEACPEDIDSLEWNISTIEKNLSSLFIDQFTVDTNNLKIKEIQKQVSPHASKLKEYISNSVEEKELVGTITSVMLGYVDNIWVQHLESMTRLKEGIGLRSYQQEDPIRIYQREGLELFEKHYQSMRLSIVIEIINFVKLMDKTKEEDNN
ncbi:preprotein translocase subunit SecA [Psychrobacillus sp. OK028]|uniref:accessory Sec system translocase SecA2 n=1 Tax=Psychrobacillus sp. OK028 TaxID=1884359 RepID=UPI00088004E0|nr:accessory Sec system translocase SecA2 [Psychrobacillus sp. OK028]SDM42535.1 preprotein translocase subunit SecA [Psychrobacillus sp. OK028]